MPQNHSGKHILIIDDDEAILEVMSIVLKMENYQITIDKEGTFFSRKSPAFTPDLVLLDMMLGGKSGKHICLSIKSNPKTAKIPVILMSAHTENEVKKAAIDCNADGYLTKPFDIKSLSEIVKKTIA